MKKKTVVILTAVLTVLTLTMLIASAVVLTVNTGEGSDKYLGKDLTADATEITASTNEALTRFVTDGNVNTFWQGERRGSYIQFYFEKGIEFNTVVISETGMSISAFEIYVSNNGKHFDKVYEQDRIQRGRLCAMTGQLNAKYVTLRIIDSEASPRINDISIYNAKKAGEDFTLASRFDIEDAVYRIADWNAEGITPEYDEVYELFDGAKLGLFDEVVIDAGIVWSADGELLADNVISDNVEASEFTLDNIVKALGYLNEVKSENTKFILSLSAKNLDAVNTDYSVLARNVKRFLADNGFDGAEIDCALADGKNQCIYYADAIEALRGALGEETYISAALTTGQLKYYSGVADKIDKVNLVGFGQLDQNGDSAAFYASCIQAVDICLNNGFKEKQINLGAPLYGAYSEDAEEVYAYSSVEGEYGWYDNVFECAWREERVSDIRFNGKQLLYDKTCYAIYRGLGGITLFALECDRAGIGEDTLSYAACKAVSDAEGRV